MDQNHFINTYIDVSINSLLEYVKTNLQLQTQVKVSESVIGHKDQVIADLTKQLSENKLAEDWKTKYDAAEANYSAAMGKLNHMNNLMTQIADIKQQIVYKDARINNLEKELEISNKDNLTKSLTLEKYTEKISNLEQELESIKDAKKVINTKVKKKDETKSEKTLDDF